MLFDLLWSISFAFYLADFFFNTFSIAFLFSLNDKLFGFLKHKRNWLEFWSRRRVWNFFMARDAKTLLTWFIVWMFELFLRFFSIEICLVANAIARFSSSTYCLTSCSLSLSSSYFWCLSRASNSLPAFSVAMSVNFYARYYSYANLLIRFSSAWFFKI